MYGRRNRGYGGGGGGFGLVLLAMQFYNFISRNNRIFPVMLGVLALNVAVYLRPDVLHWPPVHNACISATKVWLGKKWQPLLYSVFTHAGEFHLYFNMASFMWKAATLEHHFGSAYFLYMISVFSTLTGVVYVAIEILLSEFLNDWSYMTACAVGFSGVIFALKVVTTHLLPPGTSNVMGIPFPSRLACWAELLLISVITPNASFVGHLAGILVGLAFVWGPLKLAMDVPLKLLGSFAPRDFTGGASRGTRFTQSARTTGYRNDRNSEEEDLQAAIRLSRNQERQDQFLHQQQRHDRYQHQDQHQDQHVVQSDSTDGADIQTAIERSMEGSGDSRSLPPTDPPPPVNPYYNSSSSETSSISSPISASASESSSSLPYPADGDSSGMPVPAHHDGLHTRDRTNWSSRDHPHQRSEPRVLSDDKSAIRAARLRRFGKSS